MPIRYQNSNTNSNWKLAMLARVMKEFCVNKYVLGGIYFSLLSLPSNLNLYITYQWIWDIFMTYLGKSNPHWNLLQHYAPIIWEANNPHLLVSLCNCCDYFKIKIILNVFLSLKIYNKTKEKAIRRLIVCIVGYLSWEKKFLILLFRSGSNMNLSYNMFACVCNNICKRQRIIYTTWMYLKLTVSLVCMIHKCKVDLNCQIQPFIQPSISAWFFSYMTCRRFNKYLHVV